MNVLLVQVPTSHLGAKEKVYPLGLSRLSSTLPKEIEKKVLDMNIDPDPWKKLKALLEQESPDSVVLSFRNIDPLAGHQASYLSSLKTTAALCRQMLPHARIIAGGPAFSLFAERLMQEIPQIDLGLKGEGEMIFPTLFQAGIRPESIPGMLWRDGGRIRINPLGKKISLDHLPPMDLASIPPEGYLKGNNYVASMGIEGKRGCDLLCGYCRYPFLGGPKIRLRDPENIADEMELLNKEHGVELFHFTDPVVNRPADHFEAVCSALIRRKLTAGWTGFFREDSISTSLLTLAERAGLAAVYFSGDALTDYGLTLLGKQMTTKELLSASRMTVQTGMLTMLHFLVNLPGETDEHVDQTFDLLDELLAIHHPVGNLGAVIFNHVRLYPKAPLTRKLIKSGSLSAGTDLLYPVYHNPAKYAHLLHQLEARCHAAGVFSRLKLSPAQNFSIRRHRSGFNSEESMPLT
jgi:anaerobic magnesium-protoporphyrin IX monomethyl ester cyclase